MNFTQYSNKRSNKSVNADICKCIMEIYRLNRILVHLAGYKINKHDIYISFL